MEQKEKKRQNQFHPVFTDAMKLELRESREFLTFTEEKILNTGPIKIDLLIIKMNGDVKPVNSIGNIFKKHNLWEYKRPRDTISYKVYCRSMAYLHLYIFQSSEDIRIEDTTLSFIGRSKPVKLLKLFRVLGFEISEYEPGIIYAKKAGHPDMQFITTRLLKGHEWLSAPNEGIGDVKALELENLTIGFDEADKNKAINIIDFSYSLKKNKYKGDEHMGVISDYYEEKYSGIMAERDARIESMSKEIETKDKELETKDKELETKDNELKTKDNELNDTKKELNEIKAKNKKLMKMLKKLDVTAVL